MNNTDSANDEYEAVPLRKGEYLIHPDARVGDVQKRIFELLEKGLHKWLSEIQEGVLPKGG